MVPVFGHPLADVEPLPEKKVSKPIAWMAAFKFEVQKLESSLVVEKPDPYPKGYPDSEEYIELKLIDETGVTEWVFTPTRSSELPPPPQSQQDRRTNKIIVKASSYQYKQMNYHEK